MEVQISARHCTISDTTQDHLKAEVDALGKFYPNITAASIVLDRAGDLNRKCDISLNVKGTVIVASADEENMGKAIDVALERAKSQLKKANEKQNAHQSESVADLAAGKN
jgi:ribosomal subunit interface protein